MFTIEKNIPIPTETQDAEKYPFNQMEIGESFIACVDLPENFDLIAKVKERNESGDGRLFYFTEIKDNESAAKIQRVWRVSLETYLESIEVDEKHCLESILDLIREDGPVPARIIIRANVDGTQAMRRHLLKKYAFLFNIKKRAERGGGFLYSIK